MQGYLSEAELTAARNLVPIVCVDVVPWRRRANGSLQAGLILRDMPGRAQPVWCHLGGRVRRGETLRGALVRHVTSTLVDVPLHLPADPQPAGAVQWFSTTDPVEEGLQHGYDPRQHAVALVFDLHLDVDPRVVAGGEARDFRWWSPAELPEQQDTLWPGTRLTVRRALEGRQRNL